MKRIKWYLAGVGFVMLSACMGKKQTAAEPMDMKEFVYMCVGSYASAENEGIRLFQLNQETGDVVFLNGMKGIANPSFLTVSSDGKHIYAVGENDETSSTANVICFSEPERKLEWLSSSLTHGGAPCNIVLSPDAHFVLTANYGGGSLSVIPLMRDGKAGKADTILFTGCGPDKERQAQPHLHCVQFTPDGKKLFASDLGTDRIYVFPVKNGAKDLLDREKMVDIKLPDGCGPRHLCFSQDGKRVYLITELSGEVIVLLNNGAEFHESQRIQSDTLKAKGSADIHLSPDGRFLYASNRLKGDGIAVFKVSEEDGTLTKVGYQSTGLHPRHFNLTPNGKFLLVACRDTDEIQIYKRDKLTGLLEDTGKRIKMPKPVCVQFIP